MNESNGPRQVVEEFCRDVFQIDLTREVEAHAVDGTLGIHCDPGSLVLFRSGIGLVRAHSARRREIVAPSATASIPWRGQWCYVVTTTPRTLLLP